MTWALFVWEFSWWHVLRAGHTEIFSSQTFFYANELFCSTTHSSALQTTLPVQSHFKSLVLFYVSDGIFSLFYGMIPPSVSHMRKCGIRRVTCLPPSLPGVEKEEQSPLSEAWDVDEGLISKLKEQYKKERKGKKGVKSKWARSSFTRRLLFLYTSSGEPISQSHRLISLNHVQLLFHPKVQGIFQDFTHHHPDNFSCNIHRHFHLFFYSFHCGNVYIFSYFHFHIWLWLEM